MWCKEWREPIEAKVEGLLDPSEEKPLLAHLDICRECRRLESALHKESAALLRALRRAPNRRAHRFWKPLTAVACLGMVFLAGAAAGISFEEQRARASLQRTEDQGQVQGKDGEQERTPFAPRAEPHPFDSTFEIITYSR